MNLSGLEVSLVDLENPRLSSEIMFQKERKKKGKWTNK